MMTILYTHRLTLRPLTIDDGAFMLTLLNEPSFINNIGDRGVRTRAKAEEYILKKVVASYELNGFGMYAVELKKTKDLIGICGLVKRDSMNDIEIGFAFLPQFWRQGYAFESAQAFLSEAKMKLGLKRLAGITSEHNHGSIKVLEKLGLSFKEQRVLDPTSDNDKPVRIYIIEL